MKYKLIFISLFGLYNSIFGGAYLSRSAYELGKQQQTTFTIEQVKEEFNTYLKDVSSESSNKPICNNLIKDILHPHKLPVFKAYIQQDSFRKNENRQKELIAFINSITNNCGNN